MGYGSRLASKPADLIRLDFASTNVDTSAWVELSASLGHNNITAQISNGSDKDLKLGYGPAGGEVDLIYVPASQNVIVPFHIGQSTRLAVRSLSGTASSGRLVINTFI